MIWIIGSRGMLGSEVKTLLHETDESYCVSDREVDITSWDSLSEFSMNKPISWIVNCAAYTAVDRAEDEPAAAFAINETGAANIARIANAKNARLIHISTDYVFDGSKEGAYTEDDPTGPVGVYGKSKLGGEKMIVATTPGYFIIRTAWLYGKNGPNFVNTMIRLFRERGEVRVVNDQRGSPTFARDLADAILRIAGNDSRRYGVYHYSNEGDISWFDFAAEIYRLVHIHGLIERDVSVVPITTEEYPTRAFRPKNSVLSKEKIKNELGLEIRDWKTALEQFIRTLPAAGA